MSFTGQFTGRLEDQKLRRGKAIHDKFSASRNKLAKADVDWVVFAGAAAYCYGSRRQITDIDILVKSVDLRKAEGVLKDIEGFEVVADLEIETEQGICRFFVDDEMIDRIEWKQLFGVTVPVIPVEDNIVFKAILQKGEDRGKHDIEDIRHMVENKKVDLEYLQKRIEKYNAEKRVRPLLKILGIL